MALVFDVEPVADEESQTPILLPSVKPPPYDVLREGLNEDSS